MVRNLRRYFRLLPNIALLFVLTACALGPEFARPFNKASESSDGFINAVYQDSAADKGISLWWERINDPLLNRYIDQLLSENLQLAQAGERVLQARIGARSTRASFFPTLGVDGSASRSFSGNIGGNFGSNNIFGGGRVFTENYDAALGSSWEIDLFGKIRRSVEAADANALASAYDRQALIHSLIASLVDVRVEIAVYKSLLDLAIINVQNREDVLALIERRYEIGAANTSPQNVMRAKNDVSVAQADVHRYMRLLSDATYRLDVLLGQRPGTTNPLKNPFPMLAPARDVPVCLPADLLDRRPDLRSAELRVRAETANIGIAIADLYPSLSLSGSLGFSNNSTRNLFSADQLTGSMLAAITSRIFEGGRLRANIDLQKSEAREAAAAYAEQVLEAMREVESGLKSERELQNELDAAQDSVDALTTAENIVKGRYMRGIASLNEFLDAQRELYQAQQTLLMLQQVRWNTRTALYLALGGDWFGDEARAQCNNIDDSEKVE